MKTIEAPTKTGGHRVVSQTEWIDARKKLLEKEKAHVRVSDELARERRQLPWVKVEKEYVFDTPAGKRTLAELFDGASSSSSTTSCSRRGGSTGASAVLTSRITSTG